MKPFWNWGVGIATVYAIFAGATLGFVTFAMSERVDLVSPDYYVESLGHDARQDAAARASALGSSFHIERGQAGVTIQWPHDARPDRGSVTLYRPADSRADRRIATAPDRDGQQVISIAAIPAGAWVVQCEWTSGGVTYYAEKRVDVR